MSRTIRGEKRDKGMKTFVFFLQDNACVAFREILFDSLFFAFASYCCIFLLFIVCFPIPFNICVLPAPAFSYS